MAEKKRLEKFIRAYAELEIALVDFIQECVDLEMDEVFDNGEYGVSVCSKTEAMLDIHAGMRKDLERATGLGFKVIRIE
jgi:hypothetical protein